MLDVFYRLFVPFAFPSLAEMLAAADAALGRQHPRQDAIRRLKHVVLPTEPACAEDREAADDHIKLWDDFENGKMAAGSGGGARASRPTCPYVVRARARTAG